MTLETDLRPLMRFVTRAPGLDAPAAGEPGDAARATAHLDESGGGRLGGGAIGFGGAAGLGPTAVDVCRRLRQLVESGVRRPGERLGGERDLAADLGVSRATLRQALTALEREGVVVRVQGRGGGTFIAPRKVERDLSRIVGVPELLRSQGFTAGTQVIRAGLVSAEPDVADALGLPVGELVAEIVRLRLADGSPMALECARFPACRFPGLLEQPLGGSLYELFAERYDIRPGEAVEQIEVIGAGDEDAALLRTAVGAPLLALDRTTCDLAGEPFEYSRDLLRADRIRIVVRSSGTGVLPTA